MQLPADSAGGVPGPPVPFDSARALVEDATARLADSIARLGDALNDPSWWDRGAGVATIVIAVLAGVELWRIYRDREETKQRAEARVSALAIPVHRSIKSWLGEMPTAVEQIEERDACGAQWTSAAADAARDAWAYWTARSARSDIGKAQRRIEDLNAEAPLAGERVRDRVVRATAAFYRAFDALNPVMAEDWGTGAITANPPTTRHRQQLSDGHKRLRRCLVELEELIDERFLRAAEDV